MKILVPDFLLLCVWCFLFFVQSLVSIDFAKGDWGPWVQRSDKEDVRIVCWVAIPVKGDWYRVEKGTSLSGGDCLFHGLAGIWWDSGRKWLHVHNGLIDLTFSTAWHC